MSSGSGRNGAGDDVTVAFAVHYADSQQFKAVFREGMALVERAASYLDGDGRRDARGLSSSASLAYATESMLLTTRLMQLASWLLIRRAVNEGELTRDEAAEEHHKVKLKPVTASARTSVYEDLPPRLRDLIEASLRLHQRIVRLDAMMNARGRERSATGANPLAAQIDCLRAVFEGKSGNDDGR